VLFTLVGGAASYFWVNGMPGFLRSQSTETPGAPPAPAANAASAAQEG
jgi:hypothetical protein